MRLTKRLCIACTKPKLKRNSNYNTSRNAFRLTLRAYPKWILNNFNQRTTNVQLSYNTCKMNSKCNQLKYISNSANIINTIGTVFAWGANLIKPILARCLHGDATIVPNKVSRYSLYLQIMFVILLILPIFVIYKT